MFKMSNPAKPAVIVCAAFCIATLLFTASCNNGPGGGGTGKDSGVVIPNLPDSSELAKIEHYIPKGEIMRFRRAFNADSLNARNPDLFITESEGFNKTALLELLKDPKCVGIRIYYGIAPGTSKKKDLRMILVGTDSQGKDLYFTHTTSKAGTRLTDDEVGLEYGQCCHGQPAEN